MVEELSSIVQGRGETLPRHATTRSPWHHAHNAAYPTAGKGSHLGRPDEEEMKLPPRSQQR